MTMILLADDHDVVRYGLRALLSAERDFTIIGEVADGLQVVPLVERLKPDVLIVDVMMPGLCGLEITRQVSQRIPDTHIVVLSMHADEAYVLQALRNGASAYVLKDCSTADLVHAVREVVAGRRYLSPPLSKRALEAYVDKAKESAVDPLETLTSREREVFFLTAEGHTTTEIGTRLAISPRTAEVHRANLMRKLGLQTQTDLIRYALQRGILPLKL